LLLLVVAPAACVTREELAAQLNQAATISSLGAVSACWESHFEASGFRGSYLAKVNFVARPDGTLGDSEVAALFDTSQGEHQPAHDAGGFKRCIEAALDATRLDGFAPPRELTVIGYRIAFRDASEGAREAASEQSSEVLIGPRTDRCKGLYGYEPARELTLVQGELDSARAEADGATSEPAAYARALQKSYDLALEVRERLRIERKRDDLPDGSRKRIEQELDRVKQVARDIGRKIGCYTLPD
jgi:hypothetical protein